MSADPNRQKITDYRQANVTRIIMILGIPKPKLFCLPSSSKLASILQLPRKVVAGMGPAGST